ncbi:hypothetical protein MYX84_13800 [Acidobacteria bacterium AH-259-O06]|nr:hypothetical protein [Acidobacteria bacterium AH-259-O06]
MLSKLTGKIKDAYAGLGYDEGWRFLYGPASTLSPDTQIAFVGLNPGGTRERAQANNTFIKPFVPEGNAYRIERGWNKRHQEEVCLLFKGLAAALGKPNSWQGLMDEGTLTSNFCPFRSANWNALTKKDDALAFSRELWAEILGKVTPSVMLCNGKGSLLHFKSLLGELGWKVTETTEIPTGWGDYSYYIVRFKCSSSLLTLVGLPHLSRFKTMSSSKCSQQTAQLLRFVSTEISNPN